jgi:hypothetical protein
MRIAETMFHAAEAGVVAGVFEKAQRKQREYERTCRRSFPLPAGGGSSGGGGGPGGGPIPHQT